MSKTSQDGHISQELNEVPTNVFTSVTTPHTVPDYIQNTLLALGYDRLQTIARLDVSETGQTNDIDRILNYVKQKFPNDTRLVIVIIVNYFDVALHLYCRFSRGDWACLEPDIPPGHRILLSNFVKDVRKQVNPYVKKVKSYHTKGVHPTNSLTTKECHLSAVSDRTGDSSTASDLGVDDPVDLAENTLKIRKQIITWQHAQNNIHLRQLKEHKEYRVIVEPNANPQSNFSAAILCIMCDKKVILGVSQSKVVRLSNWIRHVKGCVQQNRGKQTSQLALTSFFGSSGSGSPAAVTPDLSMPVSSSNVTTPDLPQI